MLKINDRVIHKDVKYEHLGILTILEIRNEMAICGYLDFDRIHLQPYTFGINELERVE